MIRNAPKKITVCNLEVVLMPNGEIICSGKTLGWIKELGCFLTVKNQRCVTVTTLKPLRGDLRAKPSAS